MMAPMSIWLMTTLAPIADRHIGLKKFFRSSSLWLLVSRPDVAFVPRFRGV